MLDPRLHGAPIPMVPAPMPGPYHQLGYFTGFPDPMMFNTAKSHKNRRKSGAGINLGTDHVKHRRTRSGCFMCRGRRVKVCWKLKLEKPLKTLSDSFQCDETRPVCERELQPELSYVIKQRNTDVVKVVRRVTAIAFIQTLLTRRLELGPAVSSKTLLPQHHRLAPLHQTQMRMKRQSKS